MDTDTLSLKTPTVLAVDDETAACTMMRLTLEHAGFDVHVAHDGTAALAFLQTRMPDVILMDVIMPRMDGFEACRRIRRMAGGEHLPIVMITGMDDPASIDKAYQAGATSFIAKPINWPLLRHQIDHVLRASQNLQLLQGREEQLRNTQSHARICSWRMDAGTRHIDWSEEASSVIGQPPNLLVDLASLSRYVYPEDRIEFQQSLSDALAHGRRYTTEFRVLDPDGNPHWLECQGEPALGPDGDIKALVGFIQDIDTRKRSELEIKASLAEKEVLLREIHHRVKNNLQVVVGLLSLQAMQAPGKESSGALLESCRRIQVMAQIHNELYRSTDLGHVKIDALVNHLAEELIKSSDTGVNRLQLETDLQPVALDIAQALPCGQILSELLSNSLKHAFPPGSEGVIKVQLKRTETGCELQVADNGIGMPANKRLDEYHSVGLQVVQALTEQLNGRIEMYQNHGTSFRLSF